MMGRSILGSQIVFSLMFLSHLCAQVQRLVRVCEWDLNSVD
jgi:hypothetical protein